MPDIASQLDAATVAKLARHTTNTPDSARFRVSKVGDRVVAVRDPGGLVLDLDAATARQLGRELLDAGAYRAMSRRTRLARTRPPPRCVKCGWAVKDRRWLLCWKCQDKQDQQTGIVAGQQDKISKSNSGGLPRAVAPCFSLPATLKHALRVTLSGQIGG